MTNGMVDASVHLVLFVGQTLDGGAPIVPTISVIMRRMDGIVVTTAVNPTSENNPLTFYRSCGRVWHYESYI